MTEPLLTPYEVERKLLALSDAQQKATEDLAEAEALWINCKRDLELALARARKAMSESGERFTVQEKIDNAVIACEQERIAADAAEIWVRGTRAQVANLKAQEDIIRSIGVSIRASMDLA